MPETSTTTASRELAAELAREQAVVDRAHARLEQLRAEAAARERESLRPSAGTPQAVYERDVAALAASARRADLDEAGEGLVFGRLDLADGTVHHLGRLGLRTERQEPIVVDWRAPAAAPFYRATAADPLGVVRRRTISTRGLRVVGVDDELLDVDAADRLEGTVVVGDGAFVAALSRERTGRMRDIVATIQREQDEAVRAPDDGALVVTGGPGTGKTAVALHRVAYLMYARREWYERRGVLVVGPSPVFVDYISAVLPALGETSVRLASLGALPDLPRGWAVDAWDPPVAAVAKGSVRMATVLRRVVKHLGGPRRVADLEVVRWGTTVTVRGGDLARRRAQVGRSARSHNAGRAAFAAAALELVWRAWDRRPGASRSESDAPLDGRTDFESWLRTDDRFRAWLDATWPVLLPADVMTMLRHGEVPLRELAGDLLDDAELVALEASWARGQAHLSPGDAAIWDELAELLGAPPVEEEPDDWDEASDLDELARTAEVTTFADRTRSGRRNLADDRDYRTFAHVVVDEAQDVTPMQWRMLGRRGRGATWTVVGDWLQSAWPDVDEVRGALDATLGRARVRSVELTTNYRTSTEIAALAARLLARLEPGASPPEAVRQTGVPPLLAVGDPVAMVESVVQDLLDAVGGTVGVVAPHGLVDEVLEVLGGLLEDVPRLSLLDPWSVKGLEFDACVVLDPHAVVAEARNERAGLRSLYVALTRATQRLAVVGRAPLEDLLA
ncbi:MAG: HelD family protein [Actinomycetes bacterium]